MSVTRVVLIGGTTLLLLIAGCSAETSGQPEPAGAGSSQAPSGSARPKELSLDGIDTCSLITDPQREKLNLKQGKPAEPDVVTGLPQCEWPIGNQGSFTVEGDTKNGIENSRRTGSPKRDIAIGNYRAVQIHDTPKGCTVAVDVTQGQQLVVDYFNPGLKKLTFDEMCRSARSYAEAALTTLKTMK